MAQTYTLTASGGVVRGSDGAFIPNDPMNADWQAYEVWVAAGNAAAPYVPPPAPVPSSISRRQFFQQLATQGIITQAEALAAVQTGAIPTELSTLVSALPAAAQFAAQMKISGASDFLLTDPLTQELATAYGWTTAQVDALWTAAAAL
ncbi:MAG: hypothetical protein WDN29_16395 [Methylovirgula sp.]